LLAYYFDLPIRLLEVKNMQTHKISTWNKMVHAPFKKVVKFDLICMGLGVLMGMGIGAFLATNL